MSAEAIARLRERVRGHVVKMSHVPETCELCAIIALLDAHAEALDALEPLYRKNKLREGYCRDATCPHCNELRAAEAVLAKAGRRE